MLELLSEDSVEIGLWVLNDPQLDQKQKSSLILLLLLSYYFPVIIIIILLLLETFYDYGFESFGSMAIMEKKLMSPLE